MYITIGEDLASGEKGVSRKLLSKVAAIQSHVKKCMLLNASVNINHDEIRIAGKNDLFLDLEIGVKSGNTGYFNKIKSERLFFKRLASYIKDNLAGFDRIIFRYPFASLGLKQFTAEFYKKIVFEHNTKEIEELKVNISNKNYAFFNLRPSRLLFWYQEKKYPLYCERFVAGKIFDLAHSGSCVTTEIAEYEKHRNRSYKTFVSSNFYDVKSAPLSQSSYEAGQQLTLGMIVTTTAAWYGLERLLRSFAPVQDDCKLILAGIDAQDPMVKKLVQQYNIKRNLIFPGRINKEQLSSFYNSVHACFGSLGLHTLNLRDASTLKVKESVSYGVPVIVGYNEEDFIHNKAFAPYYLQVKNDDSIIDFERIRSFVSGFYADPQNRRMLRELALKHMDVNVKVNSLLSKIAA